MKKLLFLLLVCSSITTVYSSRFSGKKGLSEKHTMCTDTLNVAANIAYPVKVSLNTFGYGPDHIEIAIIDDTLTNHYVSHFTKFVSEKSDTLINLIPGYYYFVTLSGGASLEAPELSGDNISVSKGGWIRMTNYSALPFKVIGSDVVCEGPALLNVDSYYTGTGTLKYKWTPSTGLNNDTLRNPTATVTNNISYIVTTTSPNGCIASSTINLTVTPLIATTDSIKTSTCGSAIQLNSLTTNYNGTGKLKYKWTPSTGLNSDTIAHPTAIVTSDITYSVTVTTPSGCTSTSFTRVPVMPLTAFAGQDQSVGYGSTVHLNAYTNFTGAGKLKYKWTPSTGLDNDTIVNPTATIIKNITYNVAITSPSGCPASASVVIKIIPMAQPVIGIVSVNSSNKNVIVWNKPVSTAIESYSIYKETNVSNAYEKIGSVSNDSLSVFVDNQSAPNVKSNKYKLSVIDRSGMESPLSDAHKTMHLSINKGQNSTYNLIWEPYEGFNVSTYNIYKGTSLNSLNFLDATSGSSTQFTDITVTEGEVFYQLEVISPVYINPSKSVALIQKTKESDNTITAILTSYNSSRSNIASNVVSGLNDLNGESSNITIYPNPFKNELKIDCVGGSTFEILNLMGQAVYTGDLTKSGIVETSGMSCGVYLIRFKSGTDFEYKKIIKE